MGVLGEFKRGVDVAHGDWFGVRECTHLLGVHPLHPKKKKTHLSLNSINLNCVKQQYNEFDKRDKFYTRISILYINELEDSQFFMYDLVNCNEV
ncbi:hypothetical protein Hanom_Chr16g01490031 [Helianthus anomalus]